MMDAIPATGPNPAKARFFKECASAFQFMALFYSLSEQDQVEITQLVQQYHAAAYKAQEQDATRTARKAGART